EGCGARRPRAVRLGERRLWGRRGRSRDRAALHALVHPRPPAKRLDARLQGAAAVEARAPRPAGRRPRASTSRRRGFDRLCLSWLGGGGTTPSRKKPQSQDARIREIVKSREGPVELTGPSVKSREGPVELTGPSVK